METCENCGRQIGKLETPHIHDNHVVCANCKNILDAQTPTLSTADIVLDDSPRALGYESKTLRKSGIANIDDDGMPVLSGRPPCPMCGSRAKPVRKAKGSSAMLIILLLLWILPGLLYLVFYNGYIYVCPACGAKLADAT